MLGGIQFPIISVSFLGKSEPSFPHGVKLLILIFPFFFRNRPTKTG